ncbi:MAG TPA: hypothetical protein VL358_04560 [Caulobacteraceae bacterium]|jgi:hypothetical protein|nr:hypothetical protein [Caulobacteraceae bacterium]
MRPHLGKTCISLGDFIGGQAAPAPKPQPWRPDVEPAAFAWHRRFTRKT